MKGVPGLEVEKKGEREKGKIKVIIHWHHPALHEVPMRKMKRAKSDGDGKPP